MKKILVSLLLIVLFLAGAKTAHAGTDLTATCNDNGPCTLSPAGTPIFNEQNAFPGETYFQTLTITNNDSDESCNVLLDAVDTTAGQPINLADRIFTAMESGATPYFGVVSGGTATSVFDLQNAYDAGQISLGTLVPGQTRVYDWHAQFDPAAGNEYQNVMTEFDATLNIECGTPPGPSPSPSNPPSSPGPGSSPGPDGSPSSSPGPSGGTTNTPFGGLVLGATTFARNLGGQLGQILGVTIDEIATDSAQPAPSGSPTPGDVAGVMDICAAWTVYIPWVLLIAQLILVLLSELFFRRNHGWTKHFIAAILTLASIAIFYLIRECDCAQGGNWWQWFLIWLCKWYWIVAIIVTLLVKVISYLFIEEEARPQPVSQPTRVNRRRSR